MSNDTSEAIKSLRATGGDGWDSVSNIDAELRDIRGECDKEKDFLLNELLERCERVISRHDFQALGTMPRDSQAIEDLRNTVDKIRELKRKVKVKV